MSKFKAGQFDVVVTVDMFNEGVDIPNVDLVAFLRATHSRRIFVQQLGRGLRVSDDKDKVIVRIIEDSPPPAVLPLCLPKGIIWNPGHSPPPAGFPFVFSQGKCIVFFRKIHEKL